MSLFVGNISKNVRRADVIDEFEKFGKCDLSFKVQIIMIDNLSRGVRLHLLSMTMKEMLKTPLKTFKAKIWAGLNLTLVFYPLSCNIIVLHLEWSKKSGRYDPKSSKRPIRGE